MDMHSNCLNIVSHVTSNPQLECVIWSHHKQNTFYITSNYPVSEEYNTFLITQLRY